MKANATQISSYIDRKEKIEKGKLEPLVEYRDNPENRMWESVSL